MLLVAISIFMRSSSDANFEVWIWRCHLGSKFISEMKGCNYHYIDNWIQFFRLQFRSSSTTPKSKSISSARSQSPINVSPLGSSERSSAHAQSLPTSNHIQSKNVFASNGYQIGSTNERPRSLPGLQVATGSHDSPKLSNLMSPPVCPPPKSGNQLTKGIIPAGNSPVYADTGCQGRGASSTFPQGTNPTSFPILIQQSPQQLQGLPGQASLSSPIPESHGKRQILAQRTSLKRSDSCPYPSQSPRPRQMSAAQVMNPTTTTQQHSNTVTPDIIRWGYLCQKDVSFGIMHFMLTDERLA